MPKRSRPFVVATEGPTVDNRHISREWITQMAANYDPAVYTAVVNLEHLLSLAPDSVFSAYGKVVNLATQEADILGQPRLQLTAVVEASDAAIAMQKNGKKCFASMEVIPNFCGQGLAYLTGLALTDTPASVGTEPMRFSAFSGAASDAVYCSPAETELIFPAPEQDKAAATEENGFALLAAIRSLFGLADDKAPPEHDPHTPDAKKNLAVDPKIADAMRLFADAQDDLSRRIAALSKTDDEAKAALAELSGRLEALTLQLKTADATQKLPPAPGGAGVMTTDC